MEGVMAGMRQVNRWSRNGDAQVRRHVHALVSEALALLDEADIDSLVAARLQAALDSMVLTELAPHDPSWRDLPKD
jgi:hypothetical protein